MFVSFFPKPRLFFLSVLLWTAVVIGVWFSGLSEWQVAHDFFAPYMPVADPSGRPPFLNGEKAWTYTYIVACSGLFALFWGFFERNKWYAWSVVGSTIIIVANYFNVQISVYLNDWYGGFYDLLQKALTTPGSITLAQFYGEIFTVAWILVINIAALVLLDFFVSHYVFRWRNAMNDFYMERWQRLRHIEGAAQRVQEDTMRFARIVEGLGVSFVRSLMTLIAFLPLLYALSGHVTEMPLVGKVDGSLVFLALASAAFGTVLLALVGIKLPGLEFNNQRVEAAYRKELVYGEDFADRAQPATVSELFSAVRQNYFRLYFHYLYFGVARWTYLQASNFVPLIALGPTVVAGAITFGIFTQISNAFDQVENSFKFLANSWTTIIDLISIYKRLMAFESGLSGGDVLGADAIAAVE